MDIPAELRLQIYGHLVNDCLDYDSPTKMAGLYLSCHTVCDELEKDFIASIRPALEAKRSWEACGLSSLPLKVTITSQTASTEPCIDMEIPYDQSWVEQEEPSLSVVVPMKLVGCLTRLCEGPW